MSDKPILLSDETIVTKKRISRRSVLVSTGLRALGTAAAAAVMAAGTGSSHASDRKWAGDVDSTRADRNPPDGRKDND